MDIKLLTPFLDSTRNVIETMAFTKITPGRPYLKEEKTTWGDITGLIGLAGSNVSGNMVISFEEDAILSIVGKMLMEEFTELSEDVLDAVGELTNMISGGSKTSLSEMGYKIEMASPMMIKGKGAELAQNPSEQPIFVIPFTTDKGDFVVEASLAKK